MKREREREKEREMIKVRNDEQKKARIQHQRKYRDKKRERLGEAAYLAENARYERDRRLRIKAMGKPRVQSMTYGAVRKRIQRERTALKKREAELAAMARINATNKDDESSVIADPGNIPPASIVPRKSSRQQQQYRRRSIHEINISKNANYLEYMPTNNRKKNNPSNNSVLKINNVNEKEPPIHPVTDTNSDQSRPRHFTTPEMIKRLDPICLDKTIGPHECYSNDRKTLKSSADVVKVTFKDSGRTNHVLYASNSSSNNHLKDAYQLWNEYEEELRRLLNTVPLEALIRDELAGGCYGEYIFVGI